MVTATRVATGTRVEGKHGPLIPNPSGGKRRIRTTVIGTVIRSMDKGLWEVRFDFDGRRKNVKNNTLKVVDQNAGVPLDELECTTMESGPVTTAVSISTNSDPSSVSPDVRILFFRFLFRNNFDEILTFFQPPFIDPSSVDHLEDDSTDEEDEIVEDETGDLETAQPNNDFGQYTIDDLLRHQDEADIASVQHGRRKEAWEKIKSLEGTEVECKTKDDGKVIWRVVEKVIDDKYTQVREIEQEWLKKNSPMKEECSTAKELFEKLWPNDVKEEFNEFVNVVRKENINVKGRVIQLVSFCCFFKNLYSVTHILFFTKPTESEYLILRALIIAAPMFSNMGTQLWHSDSVNRKKKKVRKSLREKVDYGIYMKQWRFKQLKLLLPKTM